MASIELGPLSQHLEEDDVARVVVALRDAEVELPAIDEEVEGMVLSRDLDDDLFVDFLDRLDANDAACDIYVAADFEDAVGTGDWTVGSSHALLLVLDEMRDEFFESDEEDDGVHPEGESFDYDDDLDDDYGAVGDAGAVNLKDEHQRQMWALLSRGARESVKTGLCLFIIR